MKKVLPVLLCMFIVLSLLSGCGPAKSGQPAAQEQSTQKVVEETKQAKAEQKVEEKKAEEKEVTLKFMHFKSDVTEGINKILDTFKSKNPKIKLEVDAVKWDNFDTLLQTKLASGDVIDLITLKTGDFTAKYAKAGYLLDVTDQPFMKNVQESAIKASAVDGKNYALPVDNSPIAVFYNKKIFKDVGVEVPKTYKELMDAAAKIKAKGITPFALAWKDGWPHAMWSARDAILEIYMKGSPNWGADLMAGKTTFKNTPQWKNLCKRSKDFYTYGNKNSLGTDYAGSLDIFASGKAAMTYQGMWIISEVEKRNPDFANKDMGLFAYPATDDPNDTILEATGDVTIAIGKETKAKDQALKFLEFMASKEAADLWTTEIKTLSMIKGAKTDFAPCLADLKQYFDSGKVYDVMPYYSQIPGGWDGELYKYLQENILGSKTEDQVLEAMDKYVEKLKKK